MICGTIPQRQHLQVLQRGAHLGLVDAGPGVAAEGEGLHGAHGCQRLTHVLARLLQPQRAEAGEEVRHLVQDVLGRAVNEISKTTISFVIQC